MKDADFFHPLNGIVPERTMVAWPLGRAWRRLGKSFHGGAAKRGECEMKLRRIGVSKKAFRQAAHDPTVSIDGSVIEFDEIVKRKK